MLLFWKLVLIIKISTSQDFKTTFNYNLTSIFFSLRAKLKTPLCPRTHTVFEFWFYIATILVWFILLSFSVIWGKNSEIWQGEQTDTIFNPLSRLEQGMGWMGMYSFLTPSSVLVFRIASQCLELPSSMLK